MKEFSRRTFLGGIAATSLTGTAAAEMTCSGYDYNGVQTCTAGIPSMRFYPAVQRGQNWCWAACIQMVFATYGAYVDQEAIVYKLFGDLRDRPAAPREILYAIEGAWIDRNGRQFYASAEPLTAFSMGVWRPDAGAVAAQELAAGYPLINGAVRHATVLTAMTYRVDGYGRGMPIELVVRDPWPDSPSRRRLTDREVSGTNFLARVRVG